jgi:hypothetical protein
MGTIRRKVGSALLVVLDGRRMLYAQQPLLLIHGISDERCTRAALIYVYMDDRSTRSYCVHRVWMSGNVSVDQSKTR